MGPSPVETPSGAAVTEPRYPYVHVDVPVADVESVSSELFGLGATGVEERDATTLSSPSRDGMVTLVAYVPDEQHAEGVARTLGARYAARVEMVIGDAWRDAWRVHFKPSRVGARLVVRPSWEEVRPFPGEVVVTIDPGRAFGSGIHETTRLVLREIDRHVRAGDRVLDVGTGSGILAVAALLLGAKRARAIDIDPDAISVALENARLNGVASRIAVGTTAVGRVRGVFDLVLANIQADVLATLAPAITARVAPGGTLVLSGVLRDQTDAVRAAFPDLVLRFVAVEGEWVAIVLFRRRAERP